MTSASEVLTQTYCSSGLFQWLACWAQNPKVPYLVMGCSVTSVLSSRSRRGAEPLAVAGAAIEKTVCCGSGRVSNGPTRFSSVAAGLFVSSSGIFNNSTVGHTKKMKNDAIDGAVSSFSKSVSLFQKVQKTVEVAGPVHLQDRRHDSVLKHQDSDPDSLE